MTDEAKSVVAERTRGPSALQAAVQPFDGALPLGEWLAGCFVEPQLWDALVKAAGACFAADVTSGSSGLVFADHPVIGLATVAAFCPAIRVPIRPGPDRERFGIDRLAGRLSTDRLLRIWRKGLVGELIRPDATYLMRGWGHGIDIAGLDQDLACGDGHQPHVICLLERRPDALSGEQEPRFLIADTEPQSRQILFRVLSEIRLPPQAFAQGKVSVLELLDGLMNEKGLTVDDILQALNTRGYGQFTREAELFHLQYGNLRSNKINDLIMQENKPRHAACLFVVSHFRDLAPSTFLDIADMLVSEVPTISKGADEPSDPEQITEVILEESRISFAREAGRRYAVVRSAENQTDVGAEIWNFFDSWAPLLRERFLLSMALRLTFGHPSEEIAESYRELEAQVLRELGREQIDMRLRRIMFGYAVVAGAGTDFLNSNRLQITAALARATRRMPTFLGRLFEKGGIETAGGYHLRDAIGALCTAQPIDNNPEWQSLFDDRIGKLFWMAYAANPVALTFAACPPLFGRGDMPAAGRRRRRQVLLQMLRETFDAPIGARGEDADIDGLRSPHVVAALLDDTARHFGVLVHTEAEPFADDLLGEAVAQYLYFCLRGTSWNAMASWPTEGVEDLAAAALSPRLRHWLDPRLRYAREAEAAAEGRIGAAPGRVAHLTRLLILCALDGLLGSAAWGPALEAPALTVLLLSKLSIRDDDVVKESVGGGLIGILQVWEWLCAPPEGQNVEELELLRRFAKDVLGTVPVLLLMAATRFATADGGVAFHISDRLIPTLVGAGDGATSGPLKDLLDAVKIGLDLQSHYLITCNEWTFPSQPRDNWRNAMRARQEALRAFQRALEPLRRHLTQGPVRTGGTTTPVRPPATPPSSSPAAAPVPPATPAPAETPSSAPAVDSAPTLAQAKTSQP